jgi:hypothetical protein
VARAGPSTWSVGAGLDASGPFAGVGSVGALGGGTGVAVTGELRLLRHLWLMSQLRGVLSSGGGLGGGTGVGLSGYGAVAGLRVPVTPDQPFEISGVFTAEGNRLYVAEQGPDHLALGGAAGVMLEREIVDHFGLRLGLTLARAGYVRLLDGSDGERFVLVTVDPALEVRAAF